jgi:hypothetical protein
LRIRRGAQFAQQGSKLVGTGAVGEGVSQGSVAVSADGNTAIVGGTNDNGFAGAGWVFTRSNPLWAQQGPKLVGTGAVAPNGFGGVGQGSSVALSADGNTAIVGGASDNGGDGAAWVFTRSNAVWTQQGSKLVGTGAIGSARQGASVAVSADGNTAIVGGIVDNSGAGSAWFLSNRPIDERAHSESCVYSVTLRPAAALGQQRDEVALPVIPQHDRLAVDEDLVR